MQNSGILMQTERVFVLVVISEKDEKNSQEVIDILGCIRAFVSIRRISTLSATRATGLPDLRGIR